MPAALCLMQATRLPPQRYLSAIGFLDSSTIFSKRGSPRKGSHIGFKRNSPAGQSVTWVGTLRYNQFEEKDVKLRSVDTAKLQFSFEPETVIFADGTKISSPDVLAR